MPSPSSSSTLDVKPVLSPSGGVISTAPSDSSGSLPSSRAIAKLPRSASAAVDHMPDAPDAEADPQAVMAKEVAELREEAARLRQEMRDLREKSRQEEIEDLQRKTPKRDTLSLMRDNNSNWKHHRNQDAHRSWGTSYAARLAAVEADAQLLHQHLGQTPHEIKDCRVFTWKIVDWRSTKAQTTSSPLFECGSASWLVNLERKEGSVGLFLQFLGAQDRLSPCMDFMFIFSNVKDSSVMLPVSHVTKRRFLPGSLSVGYEGLPASMLVSKATDDARPLLESNSIDITLLLRCLSDANDDLYIEEMEALEKKWKEKKKAEKAEKEKAQGVPGKK